MSNPEYDFYGGPAGGPAAGAGTADPRFGAPAETPGAPASPFVPGGLLGSTPAGRYGGPTGTAPAPPTSAAPTGGWSVQPRARRGVRRWVVGLITAVVALLVLAIVAAVALPVFLNQRAKATFTATRIVLPSSVDGLPRNPAIKVAATAKQFQQDADQAMPGLFTVSGLGYGSATNGPAAIVVVARSKRALSAVEQATMRLGAIAQISRAGDKPVPEPAGRLGGSFDCLIHDAYTTCIALDPAGMFTITVGHGDPKTRVDAARRIRESIELRA